MLTVIIIDDESRHICLDEIGPLEFSNCFKYDLFTTVADKVKCLRHDADAAIYSTLKKCVIRIGEYLYFIGYSIDEVKSYMEWKRIKL